MIGKPFARSEDTQSFTWEQIIDYSASDAAKTITQELCDTFKDGILAGWEGYDKQPYQAYKSKHFPLIYPSIATGKADKGRIVAGADHTGLMDIDLDECDADTLDAFCYQEAPVIPHLFMLGGSVSDSLHAAKFGIFKVEIPKTFDALPDEFKAVLDADHYVHELQELYWYAITGDLNTAYDLNITGTHGKSPLSGRYIGHTDLYVNEACQPYSMTNTIPYLAMYADQKRQAEALETSTISGEVSIIVGACLEILKTDGGDMFSGPGWFPFLCACKRLNADYSDVDAILGSSEGYNAQANLKRWNTLDVSRSGAGIGTLIFQAKQANFARYDAEIKPLLTTIPALATQPGKKIVKPILSPDDYVYTGKQHTIKADHILQRGQHLEDIDIDLSADRILLHCSTGTGKTHLAAKYAYTHLKRTLVLFPTRGLGQQKAKQYGVHFIEEGISPIENGMVQFGTYNALDKFTPDDLDDMTVFVDESHEMITSASKSFRGATMQMMADKLEHAKQVIYMTGTPIPFAQALDDIHTIRVVWENDTVQCEYLRTKDRLKAVLETANTGKLNLIFLDNKKTGATLAKTLESLGYTAAALSRDTEDHPIHQMIIDDACVPDDLQFLIVTRYFAQGLDLFNENLGNVYFYRKTEIHYRKQVIERFRNTRPENVFFLESVDRKKYRIAFDGPHHFHQYMEIGQSTANTYNKVIDMGRFEWAIYNAREAVKGTLSHLYCYRPDSKRFEGNRTGALYCTYLDYQRTVNADISAELDAMANYGLVSVGAIDDYKPATKTKAEQEAYETARDDVAKEARDAFKAEFDELQKLSDEQILDTQDPETPLKTRLRLLTVLLGRSFATFLIRMVADSTSKFNNIHWKAKIFQSFTAEQFSQTLVKIYALFPEGATFTNDEILSRLKNVIKDDKDFRALLDFKWSHARLNANKAVRILGRFCEIHRSDNTYKIVSHNPLFTQQKLWLEKLENDCYHEESCQSQKYINGLKKNTFVTDDYDPEIFKELCDYFDEKAQAAV